MSDLNEAVYTTLAGDAALEALVGDKIWNTRRSQGEANPALVFSRVSTQYTDSSTSHDGLAGVRYQLDAYASTLAQSSAIIGAASSALIAAYNGVPIGRRDAYIDNVDLYQVSLDISIWGSDEP